MLDIKEVMGEDLGDDVEATAFLESEVIHETLSEVSNCCGCRQDWRHRGKNSPGL